MIRSSHLNPRRVVILLLLLLFLSVLIGYLISPKLILQPITYSEGDIILQTVHITEDLLVPDKVSTRLKREKLLLDQRRIYDYDPQIFEKTRKTLEESFNRCREAYASINKQTEEIARNSRNLGLQYFALVNNKQSLEKQVAFYLEYRAVLKDRLEWFDRESSLSSKGFERKAKTDSDLNTVNQILTDLQDKISYHQRELKSFDLRFTSLDRENKKQLQLLEDKKIEANNEFDRSLSFGLTESEKKLLDFPYYSKEIETKLLVLLSDALSRKIVVSKEILPNSKDKLELRNLFSGETSVNEELVDFIDLNEARALINSISRQTFVDDESGKKNNFLTLLGQKLVRPTVFENKLEYENRKAELVANTSPVFFSVKKGEVLARAGDRASKQQVELINSYNEFISNQDKLPGMIGVIVLVFALLALICLIFSLSNLNLGVGYKHFLLILSALLITLLLVKGGGLLGDLIETRYFDVQSQAYNLILPVTLGSMLVGILINFESALITGLLTALFASIMVQNNLYFFIYSMMGCIVASLPMTRFDSRYSILLHGLKISAINLPAMLIIHLIESNQVGTFGWFGVLSAFLGGVLTATFTSILLPFFESAFDITTNLKLLELSNMNHPALKELILKAPGTYQHSIIVGNLVEAGASTIGANPLLSRVAAYYHDIGKSSNPHYFIENQAPSLPNVHDSMEPHDSAEVIINHLHNGVEISEKYRLGSDIIAILKQHHGTNLVRYFFNKAIEQNQSPGTITKTVNAQKFRYPGPKPQSLEAALVMLADVSEACCRSLDSPTPELIQEMTTKVCWNLLEDGQLDESGLTLKSFHEVVNVYGTMLTSFYHQRIKYPENKLAPTAKLSVISGK